MSLHLSTTVVPDASDSDSDHSSSNDDEDDQNWDEWVSDSLLSKTLSLFENKQFVSVAEALEYDKLAHGFDLNDICSRLSLDFHQRIRLINFIRKNKPPATSVTSLTGSEAFLSLDEYLIPAIEDDPLLQVHVDDWSDSDSDDASPEDAPVTDHHVQSLKNKLAAAKQDLVDYRALVHKQFNEVIKEPDSSQQVSTSRDDDSHYFSSYAENDIHAVMIQDKVRTSTYASFILTNPSIFRDAIVLDVGCGTGILSLFAARGGAKRVIAVDASDIAEKAEKIVKANGLDDVITVIRGKVEEITLPDGITHVDIIISEWMGYALLYESMLDSVLRARDRFLRPQGGVMAPSQCRMMLGLCEGSAIYKERIGFWNDVYGMSC
jgi:protein arginine N-methyltransferase 3